MEIPVLLLFACSHVIHASFAKDFNLELVQVLFRHGDRTPAKEEVYKNDPYIPIYEQVGYGQLTKLGKQRMYKLGQLLRERYNDFLGEYKSEDVYARSTDSDRTKMSLQLFLTGLYPPTKNTSWNYDINWMPIPTYYKAEAVDFMTSYADKLVRDMNVRVMSVLERDFVSYIDKATGQTYDGYSIFLLYLNLRAVLSMGLSLPKWCSEGAYKQLEKAHEVIYDSYVDTVSKARTTTGFTVKRLLDNVYDHENGKGPRKTYLYSVHDLQVGGYTIVHKFTGDVPKIFDFGSAVVVEKLRGSDNHVYLRMYMWTGVTERWIPLKLDNCDFECPLSQYAKLMSWIMPDESYRVCGKSTPSQCDLKPRCLDMPED